MPARTPQPDGSIPRSLPRFGSFPQREISRAVLFVLIHIDPRAILHAGKVFFRKFAISWEFRDAEIIRAVLSAIRKAFFLQINHKLRHLLNVLGRAHQNRSLNIQSNSVFEEGFFVLLGVLLYAHAVPGSIADDLVINVGNIHDVLDLEPAVPQKAAQNVHCQEGAEVADVPIVVDGRPARVHANFLVFERLKFLDLPRQRVIDTQSHSWAKPVILGVGKKMGQLGLAGVASLCAWARRRCPTSNT